MRDGPLAPALVRVARFTSSETEDRKQLLRDLSVKADLAGSITLTAEQMRQVAEAFGAF